jgi:DNA polymerase-3 subunit epsilon
VNGLAGEAHAGPWSVVDIETTGLHPGSDRIVELGVVRLDPTGREVGTWTTLVNPQRDIGPTRIHGISNRDVLNAPTFAQVANDLLAFVAGSVLVAHNARFDTSFLHAECDRIGAQWGPVTGLCTMATSTSLGICHSRSLRDACDELGIILMAHHTALDDARATAQLLTRLLPPRYPVPAPTPSWPTPLDRCPIHLRTDPRPPRHGSLGSLASRVGAPSSGVNAEAQAVISYLGLLDQVLEDRVLTDNEVDALNVLATEWGISAAVAADLHRHYLHTLWHLALADGVITHAERNDIEIVAELLGVPLEMPVSESPREAVPTINTAPLIEHQPKPAPSDFIGKSVCFTGESVCSIWGVPLDRARQEELANQAGMIVKSGVSSKLDILVLADPDSMSGKAVKARSLGVRCIAEHVFWRSLGIQID